MGSIESQDIGGRWSPAKADRHPAKPDRVQGWRSGESTRLPPRLPGFDSQTPRLGVICGLSLLVLYSAPRGFPRGTPVSPLLKKNTNI